MCIEAERPAWCWAAILQTIFAYFLEDPPEQCEIVSSVTSSCDCCEDTDSCIRCFDQPGTPGTFADSLDLAGVGRKDPEGPLTFLRVTEEISDGNLVLIGLIGSVHGTDFAICYGYDRNAWTLDLCMPCCRELTTSSPFDVNDFWHCGTHGVWSYSLVVTGG